MLWVWSGLSIYCSSICKVNNERVWGDKKGVIGVWADNQRSVAQLQRGWFEEKLALTWLTAHLWKTLRFWSFQTISILSCCHKSFHVLVSESTKTLTLIKAIIKRWGFYEVGNSPTPLYSSGGHTAKSLTILSNRSLFHPHHHYKYHHYPHPLSRLSGANLPSSCPRFVI